MTPDETFIFEGLHEKEAKIGNFKALLEYSPDDQRYVIGIGMISKNWGFSELSTTSFGRGFSNTLFETFEEGERCFDEVCQLLETYERMKDANKLTIS